MLAVKLGLKISMNSNESLPASGGLYMISVITGAGPPGAGCAIDFDPRATTAVKREMLSIKFSICYLFDFKNKQLYRVEILKDDETSDKEIFVCPNLHQEKPSTQKAKVECFGERPGSNLF